MAPYTQSPLGGYTQQQQQNPLQWLIDANQQAGNAVVEQITNLPGNLLKIGQQKLEGLIESSVNQAEQRKENLKAGGQQAFKQGLYDSAGMLMDAGTAGGWIDVAGMGLMEASGADFVPENLRLPLLIGGMAVSAADGTPSMLTPKQLTRLSKISPKASSIDTSKGAVKEQARVVETMRNARNVARDVKGNPKAAIDLNRNLQAAMQGQYENLYGLPGKAIVDRMNKIWSAAKTTLSPRGVGARTHHIGVLGDIDTGWSRIPQDRQLEVQYILHDKYNRLLGHNLENLMTLFSEPAHKYIGHAGGTINKPLRAAFRKFPFETASPEQTADFLEKHLRHLTAKSMNALYSKQNVDAGLAVLDAIPASLRRQLPTNFNPLSLDPKEPGKATFNKLASELPKDAQLKLRVAMMKQGAILESLKLAEKIAK